MNLISQYEQGYISYSEFEQEFPNSISESQECLFGTKCVEYYVKLTLGKTDFNYYIQKYGGDHHEIIERCSFEDTSAENVEDPFGSVLPE
ncbi:hypothetical protein EGX24_12310 [Enterococcus gallinarum]|nr:hypothetical protein EGW90_12300 [Enterococcus gallinarum]ROZ04155.1 hypothetical protein EGX16_11910 [Enterococcus gallinarum]ROZ10565.1 hypothetical protein EGX22_11920 [Enterococcus gallinarum]ROZ32835.1 hypothetical protein EGX24_12310 [Enterococcus gallinarum]